MAQERPKHHRSDKAFYTTPPTTIADNGSLYSVVVTNKLGSITSEDATLPYIRKQLLSFFPGDRIDLHSSIRQGTLVASYLLS
jgi:hypothetical protein